jgi:membrane protease YdiL (CAAX protease family)
MNFNFSNHDLNVCIPIALTLFGFSCYWFVSKSEKVKNFFYSRFTFDDASAKHIFFTKCFGFLLMGFFPWVIALFVLGKERFNYFGIAYLPNKVFFSFYWIAILSIVAVPLAYFSAKKPKNLINYPQIRAKIWTRKIFYINLLGWAIYLFGYELLFRGVLFFPLVEELGIWQAIMINIALYSATHIPKGIEETIGAIPLGIVLCLLTWESEMIWIAFFVHLAIAWTNSLTALKFHPDIKYKNWN